MLGIELDRPCQAVKTMALEHGVLLNVTREKVIRLLPPLILSNAELDQLGDTLVSVIQAFDQTGDPGEESSAV